MNRMQKYPHIIEMPACILNIFVFVFLCPMNLLISLGTCSTPKLSKYFLHTKQPNECLHLHIHQDLLHMLHFLSL